LNIRCSRRPAAGRDLHRAGQSLVRRHRRPAHQAL